MIFAQKSCKSGFSLLEIMIAVTIMGILAAVVGPQLFKYLARAKVSKAKTELRFYKGEIEQYNADCGENPKTLNDLVVCPKGFEAKWHGGGQASVKGGGYVDKINNDPWGHPYVYSPEGSDGNQFTLYSYGVDKKDKRALLNVWAL
jgi:general secretion pathway protein G